jgi:hypothetical protein
MPARPSQPRSSPGAALVDAFILILTGAYMLAVVLKMWWFPKKECTFCQVTKGNPNFNIILEVPFQIFVVGRHDLPRLLHVLVNLLLTYS